MITSRPISVLIVAGHELLRRGLEAVLGEQADLHLLGSAGGRAEALALCEHLQPDVVLLEVAPPGLEIAASLRLIRRRAPHAQILAIADTHDAALVRETLAAGAIGYLLHDTEAAELGRAIRRTAVGQPSLAPEAAQALIAATLHPPPGPGDLTEREREVLALMARGLNNPQIARRLMLSRSTVKFHVSAILARLGATSRTEAVAMAIQHHLV